MDHSSIIKIEPGKRGGKPRTRGMRISVSDVPGWLAGGQGVAEIIGDFPELTEDAIRACLAFGPELANRVPGDQTA